MVTGWSAWRQERGRQLSDHHRGRSWRDLVRLGPAAHPVLLLLQKEDQESITLLVYTFIAVVR